MNKNIAQVKNVFVSIAFWSVFVFLTFILFLVMSFVAILLYPFDKQRRVAHIQAYWWAAALIRSNPYWKVAVTGLENIDPRKSYVIVANHQSFADIIVLYKTRMQFKWVAKDSLFKLPLLGWCMSIAKHIELSRGDFTSIKKTYRKAEEWLRMNMSVLFFPEGTRSTTDQMNEFQNGAFKLALKEKKPVLPIVITGTRNAIPKGSWIFNSTANVTLHILKAVDTSAFRHHEFERLKDTVRHQFEETMNQT